MAVEVSTILLMACAAKKTMSVSVTETVIQSRLDFNLYQECDCYASHIAALVTDGWHKLNPYTGFFLFRLTHFINKLVEQVKKNLLYN